jgi:hypothetical protein
MDVMREFINIVETSEQEAWYMKGGCYQFALYLHEALGLPLYGLVDDIGALHHAFVVQGDTAIDARGEVPLDQVALYKGSPGAGTRVIPVDKAEVEEYNHGTLTDDEFDEAAEYAGEHDQLAQLINA